MNRLLLAASIFVLTFYYSITAFAQTSADSILLDFIEAAKNRTKHKVNYNGAYFSIGYPGGDVPPDIGVCTDVVIRSFRKIGIDLQKKVHEDMTENFDLYPSNKIWGLKKTDRNIDHRRVPNLRVFFMRHGKSLQISKNPAHYLPKEIVSVYSLY